MTAYIRDNYERFGNYLSIDGMRSSVCNATEFCYTAPVIKNKVGIFFCVKDLLSLKHMIHILLYWNHCLGYVF